MKPSRLGLLFGWQSLVYAVALLLGTGVISDWGRWYSSNPHYRRQVEAFFQGELALSHNPVEAIHDLTWSGGGVHQVWGLGVPLWRTPFEALARLCGQPAFPDHLAFGCATALWAFVLLRTFLGPAFEKNPSELPWGKGLLSLLLCLFCPVLLSVCSTRFDIYEEAVAYEFLFATGLLAGTVGLAQTPSWRRGWWLCLVAGFGALVRPTVLFYGVSTLLVSVAILCLQVPGSQRSKAWRSVLAGSLFAIGGLVLFSTNAARFGSGFEFGHRLNLQTLYGSVYATRFDHPFAAEPFARAARELFGLLFQVSRFSGGDFYLERFFPGQSPTTRWREMYFTTYDLSWLPLILGGWGLGLLAAFRHWRHQTASPTSENWKLKTENFPLPSIVALWSFLPAAILGAFYLRNCVISSRYLADLAPAFTAAIVALVLGWPSRRQENPASATANLSPAQGRGRVLIRRWLAALPAIALMLWLGWQNYALRNSYGRPLSLTGEELAQRQPPAIPLPEPIGSNYALTPTEGPSRAPRFARHLAGIPYNGTGWDQASGLTTPMLIFFVQDPEFLELDFATDTGAAGASLDWRWVRVKVGLEALSLESAVTLEGNVRRLRFSAHRHKSYRSGLQVAYVALGPPTSLAQALSPYRLHAVRWR